MKVLLISDSYPPWHKGGPDVVAKNLHRALSKKINVTLLTEAPKRINDENVIFIKSYKNLVLNAINSAIRRHILLRELKKYDIIHFEVLPGFKNFLIPKISKKYGKKIVITLHGSPLREINLHRSYFRRFCSMINYAFFLNNIKNIDNIIVNSNWIKKIIQDDLKKKSVMIPNGVNLERNESNKKIKLEGAQNILFWGRISPEKGVDLLIHSAKFVLEKNPMCHFYIIGDGPELKSIKKLSENLGIQKNIHYTGFLSYEEIVKYANSADITVFPSKFENSPISILEAMSIGKPIVSTDIGGIPEIVNNYENGLLAKLDSKNISEKLIILLKDKELRNKLSKNAFKTAKKFSWDIIAKNYIEYYEKIK